VGGGGGGGGGGVGSVLGSGFGQGDQREPWGGGVGLGQHGWAECRGWGGAGVLVLACRGWSAGRRGWVSLGAGVWFRRASPVCL